MSSSKQAKQIETAVEAVNWTALSSLTDSEIKDRWSDDTDTIWPEPSEFVEFELVDERTPKKPPQAAE